MKNNSSFALAITLVVAALFVGVELKASNRFFSPEHMVAEDGGPIYTAVEQMPKFPGGDVALLRYISSHVKYPAEAAKKRVQGHVIVKFVVERDGSISNVSVLRSVDPSLDREAIRLIKSMPKWHPGKQNGTTVRVKYQVPVSFRLK